MFWSVSKIFINLKAMARSVLVAVHQEEEFLLVYAFAGVQVVKFTKFAQVDPGVWSIILVGAMVQTLRHRFLFPRPQIRPGVKAAQTETVALALKPQAEVIELHRKGQRSAAV